MIDFQNKLSDAIDEMGLSFKLYSDSNSEGNSIALSSLPGGSVLETYYDGTQEKRLNYEITGKAKDVDRSVLLKDLYNLIDELSELKDLSDDTFVLSEIIINSEPYFSEATTDGYVYFRIDFQAFLTVFN